MRGQLTAVREQIENALASPEAIPAFANIHQVKLQRLLAEGQYARAAGYAAEVFTGRNPYYERMVRGGNGRFVRREIRGSEMDLRRTGDGISRTLLAYGVHEQLSTDAFVAELRTLRAGIDSEITMLDIGANIGYFTLLAARTLGDRARIYAIEPEPDNLALLDRNVAINGDQKRIDIEQYAVGDRVETAQLYLRGKSNRHMVLEPDMGQTVAERERRGDVSTGNSISVPQTTIAQFLAERSISPAAINVLRLDVEGQEKRVFDGMGDVLAAPGPTVLHIELHPRYLGQDPTVALATTLEDAGFEVVSAVIDEATCSVPDGQDWRGNPLDVTTWNALREVLSNTRFCIELVARK